MVSSPFKPTLQNDTSGAGRSFLRDVLKKSGSLVAARIAGNLLTLLYTLLLARLVPPDVFGLVMTGFAWAMLLSVGLALNVESGSIRYLVRYLDQGAFGDAAGFVRFNRGLIITLFAGLALCLGGVIWIGWLDLQSTQTQILCWATLAAPIVALTRVYGRHASAMGQVIKGGVPIMFVRPAVISALIFVVWAAGIEMTVTRVMMLFVIAFVVTALTQALLLRQSFSSFNTARPNYANKRQWLGTGAMMAPLLVIRDNLKHVVIASAGLALSPDDIGFLALALSVMSFAYFAMKAVDISLSPQVSKACQNENWARATALLKTAAKLKTAALIVGVLLLYLVGPWVLAQFGEAYGAAFLPLMVLMLIPATEALLGPAQIVLNVIGRQSAVFIAAGIGAVLLVGFTALGGWFWGVAGAAGGAGISYFLQQFALRRFVKTFCGLETSVAAFRKKLGDRVE